MQGVLKSGEGAGLRREVWRSDGEMECGPGSKKQGGIEKGSKRKRSGEGVGKRCREKTEGVKGGKVVV